MSLPSEKDIRKVAADLLRQLGGAGSPPEAPRFKGSPMARLLISQAEVRAARGRGEDVLWVPPGTLVTPLARDAANDCGIEIREQTGPQPSAVVSSEGEAAPNQGGLIALGADHGGFTLKESLKTHLQRAGIKVLDLGTHSKESCDYPDVAAQVAKAVALGDATWGILVDGAGIGSCMAANKVPGILAATCHDERTAKNSREHNGANILCLGSGSLDEAAAKRVVDAWAATAFGGGRHGRRVNKIKAIERSFVRR